MSSDECQTSADQYRKLLTQFTLASDLSESLFSDLQAEGETLAFYQRRNNALLRLLEEYGVEPMVPHIDHIQSIIKVLSVVSKPLENVLTILAGGTQVSSLHLLNLMVTESLPDIISDDLRSLSTNPLSLENWARVHALDLIRGDYDPINIPVDGIHSEYVGNDWVFKDTLPDHDAQVSK